MMEVEGLFLPNVETEKGNLVHKKVDKPSKESKEETDKPKTFRSLTLSSEKMEITAVLDLAEIHEGKAIPIEYRKGSPKRISLSQKKDELDEVESDLLQSKEPWPNDYVQIGLQSLLLEEAGYEVVEAIIYYAAEKYRLHIPIDSDVKKNALKILQEAKNCANGQRPLPLLNDARCKGCSLQPLCLPDEVNYQRFLNRPEDLTPRKFWPWRDDGVHIVVQQWGTKIGVSGSSMRIRDKEGKIIKEYPISSIESLTIMGTPQISTQAIQSLAERNIPISFLSSAGRSIAVIDPLDSISAKIRCAQVHVFEDEKRILQLTKALIRAKIANQRTMLKRNWDELSPVIYTGLATMIKKVEQAKSLDEIRGYEGQAASLYFQDFYKMIKQEPFSERFKKNGRKRRPAPDPVNAALSFAYTLLSNECVSALRQARLEPSIGMFHVNRSGRPAFALDLMEPFRPLIGDSVVITAINKCELREGHFLHTSNGYVLTDHGRKAFFRAYARRMDSYITHSVFEYRLSYRRMLSLHAKMIAAWIIDEIPDLNFLTTK